MNDTLEHIYTQFVEDAAAVHNSEDVEQLRIAYVGRKSGKLNDLLRGLKDLSPEERKSVGARANDVRSSIEQKLDELTKQYSILHQSDAYTDLTLPGISPIQGHLHPLTLVTRELNAIFTSMGFAVVDGIELENDFYNFEALNIPRSHPARDIQDTFFIKTPITRNEPRNFSDPAWVMRTHTTSMQVRLMEQQEPPMRYVMTGRVFRNEATDASHEHNFYQFDSFVVDKNVTIGQLIWSLKEIFRKLYGKDVKIRLRPGYFPFTEPSYEVDMSCVFCKQKGCRVCKKTGWLEMGGSGMINQNVFAAAGYKKGEYTGFAFGMGVNRLAMLKYGIHDIRAFMENDIRFLEQF